MNLKVIISRIQREITRHAKKKENVTHNERKIIHEIEIMGLTDKDFNKSDEYYTYHRIVF